MDEGRPVHPDEPGSTIAVGLEPRRPRGQTSRSGIPEPIFTFAEPWAATIFRPLETAYNALLGRLASTGGLAVWLTREHFFLFLLASVGLLATAPQTLALGTRWLGEYGLFPPGWGVGLSRPYVPGILYVMTALFLATFFMTRRVRIVALVVASIPVGVFLGRVTDLPSIGLYLAFLGVVFAVIKSPLPRPVKLGIIIALSLGGAWACTTLPSLNSLGISRVAAFQVTLIPMLWYSVYAEIPPKRRLTLPQFLGYHYGRLFGAPVTTYGDLFDPPSVPLAQVRFNGMKALYVVVFAALFRWVASAVISGVEAKELHGSALIVFSYVYYVAECCGTVIWFNLFIGVLRLFGVPVRDNFRYWLLARTPNEHWQRWNLLLREWVVTFVFFPIMRARRALFLAVMSALMTSGALHLAPKLLTGRVKPFQAWGILVYWLLNGFAIYVVLKVPLLFPAATDRLGIRTSRAWSVAGIILTSIFYSILVYIREACQDWSDVSDYLSRLLRVAL